MFGEDPSEEDWFLEKYLCISKDQGKKIFAHQ